MVFLTSIDILDTGFLTVSNRTGQLTTANRANSGDELRLKGVEFEYNTSSNVDSETFTANFADVEVSAVSVNPDAVRLTIYLNRSSTSSGTDVWSSNDMGNLYALTQLPKTKGFKAIYYPVDAAVASTVRKHDEQITYYLGRTDTTESQGDIDLNIATGTSTTATGKDLTDIKYVPVRFTDCSLTQSSEGGIKLTLNGFRTA